MSKVNLTGRKADAEVFKILKSRRGYYEMSDELYNKKYQGCGHGIVLIDLNKGEVVDMDYIDEHGRIINEQNIFMTEEAGKVLGFDTKRGVVRVIANFSRGQVCLF